jgi:death-on-curing family protein
MGLWHPTIRDILTAHDVVKERSKVRTEGFRHSQEEGLKKIGRVVEEAREKDNAYIAAAVYLKELIDKHAFSDGNKRTAVMITDRFLEENGKMFEPHKIHNTDELYNILKWRVPSMNIEKTAHWIRTGEIPDDNSD